jgi:hypothetical protein
VKDDVTSFNKKQVKVNVAVAGTVSALQDDVQALKDNRDFVKISRHSLEDLEPHEQELLAGWLQKLMLELDARGFAASVNQQEFLINFFNFIGVRDVLMQQQHGLDMLENFGGNELHEAIYKIFLSLCYLHDNNFDILSRLEDIDQMFKLNVADKSRIKALLENERIPALGVSGLIRMFDPTQPINSFSVESLISRNLNISSHPLLSLRLSKADYSIYLKTFAIFAPKKSRFTEKQHTYVVALANLFGCPECVFEFDKQCLNPQNVNIGAWRNFLDTDEKKYAWALDAAVLLGLNPDFDPEDDEVLEQTLKGVRISGASDFIAAAVGLTRETNSVRLYEQIVKVYGYCKGWEHVVEFCGSNLHGAFSELRNRLTKFELDLSGLSWELAKLNMNIPSDNRYVVDTSEFDSAVEKAFSKVNSKVIESGRAGHLNDLLGFRKKVEQLFEANSETLDKANAVLRVFGFESIGQRHLGFRDFNLDHSVANEEWSDHYDRHSEQINKTIEDVSETANLLEDQLCIFEDGEIYVSVSTKRQQEKEVREKQKRMELEAKRFVKVGKGENAKSVSIVWSDIEGLPFKPKDIFSLASDGNGWMALVDYWIDEGGGCFTNDHSDLYFSKDGNNWTSVEMPVSDRFSSISYLNGTWILKESRDDIYFSTDGKNWLKGKMPDSRLNDNIAVHFFDGQWLIVGKENRE